MSLDTERRVADAGAADKHAVSRGARDLPPFLGVTISVKDVIDVAGLPTTESSKALTSHVAAADAPLVQRLRDAGFIVLGKTNVPEFCSSMTSSELNGICRNPWDPERTPAGSVAAQLPRSRPRCPRSRTGPTVRDRCGYRRRSAACRNQADRGFVSFGPGRGNPYYVTSVDGILSRTVRDAAALLDVFAGAYGPRHVVAGTSDVDVERRMAREEPGSLRIAVSTTPPMGETEPESTRATAGVADVLTSLGHQVEERTPDWNAILVAALGPMNVPGPAGTVGLDQLDLVEGRATGRSSSAGPPTPSSSTRSGSSSAAPRRSTSSSSGTTSTCCSHRPAGCSRRRWTGHPGTRPES